MGHIEGQLIKQAKATRQPIPARVANAPALLQGLEFYYTAFLELSTCRSQGPIPWDKIVKYAEVHDLDQDDLQDMIFFLRSMDKVYLAHQKKAIENGKPAGSGK